MEAAHDEEHGWLRYTLDALPDADQPVVNELAPKRRGRPPKTEG